MHRLIDCSRDICMHIFVATLYWFFVIPHVLLGLPSLGDTVAPCPHISTTCAASAFLLSSALYLYNPIMVSRICCRDGLG